MTQQCNNCERVFAQIYSKSLGICRTCYLKTHIGKTANCKKCNQEKPHYALGMCHSCYSKDYTKNNRPIQLLVNGKLKKVKVNKKIELEWIKIYNKIEKIKLFLDQENIHWSKRKLTIGEISALKRESDHVVCKLLNMQVPTKYIYQIKNLKYCRTCDVKIWEEKNNCPCCGRLLRTKKRGKKLGYHFNGY